MLYSTTYTTFNAATYNKPTSKQHNWQARSMYFAVTDLVWGRIANNRTVRDDVGHLFERMGGKLMGGWMGCVQHFIFRRIEHSRSYQSTAAINYYYNHYYQKMWRIRFSQTSVWRTKKKKCICGAFFLNCRR